MKEWQKDRWSKRLMPPAVPMACGGIKINEPSVINLPLQNSARESNGDTAYKSYQNELSTCACSWCTRGSGHRLQLQLSRPIVLCTTGNQKSLICYLSTYLGCDTLGSYRSKSLIFLWPKYHLPWPKSGQNIFLMAFTLPYTYPSLPLYSSKV